MKWQGANMQLRETYYEVWLNDQLDFMSPSLKVCLDSARNARNRDYVKVYKLTLLEEEVEY